MFYKRTEDVLYNSLSYKLGDRSVGHALSVWKEENVVKRDGTEHATHNP
jgi:hypothetical protein